MSLEFIKTSCVFFHLSLAKIPGRYGYFYRWGNWVLVARSLVWGHTAGEQRGRTGDQGDNLKTRAHSGLSCSLDIAVKRSNDEFQTLRKLFPVETHRDIHLINPRVEYIYFSNRHQIKPAIICDWIAYRTWGQHRLLSYQGCSKQTLVDVAFAYYSEFAQCPFCTPKQG